MPCPWLSVSPSVKWKGLVPPSLLGKLKVKIIERAVNRVGVLLASDLPVRVQGTHWALLLLQAWLGLARLCPVFTFFFVYLACFTNFLPTCSSLEHRGIS